MAEQHYGAVVIGAGQAGVPLSQALVSTGFGYDKNRRAVQG